MRRIARLHSSSLCALLFFYNVSKKNPYSMEIEGENYAFTYSRFEYQNTVIEGRNPSNMDVVLVGTEERSGKPANGKKIIEKKQRVSVRLGQLSVAFLHGFFDYYSKTVAFCCGYSYLNACFPCRR